MNGFDSRIESLQDRLRRLVRLEHSYPFRTAREGIAASVLLLVSAGDPEIGDGDSIDLLVTRRTDRVETHKGQYALPGGMRDVGDIDLKMTALRETEEEIGIERERIETIGELPKVWTPSGFLVTPVVGLLREPRGKVVVKPNEAEIDLWFWCSLTQLENPEAYRQEEREIQMDGRNVRVPVDVFLVDTHRIWGVTGAILRNFIERWKLSDGASSANLPNI